MRAIVPINVSSTRCKAHSMPYLSAKKACQQPISNRALYLFNFGNQSPASRAITVNRFGNCKKPILSFSHFVATSPPYRSKKKLIPNRGLKMVVFGVLRRHTATNGSLCRIVSRHVASCRDILKKLCFPVVSLFNALQRAQRNVIFSQYVVFRHAVGQIGNDSGVSLRGEFLFCPLRFFNVRFRV